MVWPVRWWNTLVAEGLTKLNIKEGEIEIKEGRMEIKEYISLKEELVPKTYTTNWTRVRKVVKALRVI